MRNRFVAVIGAGLTGLTTAFYLKKQGIPFRVFDSGKVPGGVIQSHTDGEFVWETGPSTGTIGKPEVAELFEDLGEDILEIAPSISGNRFIWKAGKLHALPSGIISGLKTPLFSWKDKLGVPLEPLRPRGTNPEENLTTFVKRRLGQSILDYAVDPFVSGVYAGSPDTIVPKYALPKLYALEENYGSFILGSIHKMREPKSDRDRKATKKIFSTKGGLSTLIKTLVKKLGEENLVLGCEGLFVLRGNGGYNMHFGGQKQEFTDVIFTGGAIRLLEAFPFLEKANVDDAFKVRYASVVEVAVGFKQWLGFDLDGFGALMPSKEGRRILGVLFMSSLFQNRAPKGGAMLSTFLGGERHPEYYELPDGDIFNLVKEELTETLSIPSFNPSVFNIARHQFAIPQYDVQTPKRMAAYKEIERQNSGLFVGGNGVGGIGIADRIRQGRELAERVLTESKLN